MLSNLSSLSARYLIHRRARSLLTGLGVALGVATFFAAATTVTSLDRGFQRLTDGFAGRADVVAASVGSLDSTVPTDAADAIASLDGVEATARFLSFTTGFETVDGSEVVEAPLGAQHSGAPVALGADLDEAAALYDYELARGRFFTDGEAEALIPELLARELGVAPGDSIVLSAPRGKREVVVTGVLEDRGAGQYNDGQVAFTSLETARRLSGGGLGVSLVAIDLAPDQVAGAWITAHRADVHPGLELIEADDIAAPIRSVASAFGATLGSLAFVVLFIAAFLIYLTMTAAVRERVPTIGIMRALGTSRGAIARLIVTESAVLGAVATVVGVGLGMALTAFLLTRATSASVPLPDAGLVFTPWTLGGSIGLGLGITVLAAFIPARRAARVDPVEAIRDTGRPRRRAIPSWVPGAAVFSAGVALAPFVGERATGLVLLPILLGAVLLVPPALPVFGRLLARVGGRLGSGMGDVVLPYLTRQRTRAASTAALAMVVMAMATGLGAVATSFGETAGRQIDAQFGADVQLTANATFDQDVVDEVAAVPGVEQVATRWMGTSEIGAGDTSQRTRFSVVDPDSYFDVSGFAWEEGDTEGVREAFARGGAIAVPESVARQLDVDVGDSVTLDTIEGPRPFEVVATFASVGSSRAATSFSVVAMGIRDGRSLFAVDDPVEIHVRTARGVSPDTVAARIEDRLGDEVGFVLFTAAEVKALMGEQIDALRLALSVIIGASAIVSAVGLANMLAMAMLDRRREIGMLRAVGAFRRQIRSMAVIEATALVLVATVLAVPLGSLISRPVVDAASAAFGNAVDYTYPLTWLPVVAVIAVLVGVVASVVPARRSARIDPVEALRFE